MSEIPRQQTGDMNLNLMMNMAYNACTIVTMPVEVILHPFYGTRYFQPPVMLMTFFLMVFLPLLSSLAGGMAGMLFRGQAPQGLFSLGDFSKLFFLIAFLNGFRLWRRMIKMHTELHSEFEGPALPFFRLVPGGKSFWTTRIVIEPIFVFLIASVLENTFIIQGGLSAYLHFASVLLVMKNYIAWFNEWEYLRKLMDMRNVGPIISRLVKNEATKEELASIHLAAFPEDLPKDIHRSAVEQLAKQYSIPIPEEIERTI